MRAPGLQYLTAQTLVVCSVLFSQSQTPSPNPPSQAQTQLQAQTQTQTRTQGQPQTVLPATAQPAANIRIEVSPVAIQPSNGKLPPSVTFGVTEKDCDEKQGTDLTQGYSLAITGAGLAITSPSSTKCSIMATLTIDPGAAGRYIVFLVDNNKNHVASADIGVLDSAAGPIPPGLAPGVDVMWEVMGYKNCSDAFGRRVADSMYCIQVKIGNNGGHPLQLAGIGFSRDLKGLAQLLGTSTEEVTIANNSYASTRAVLVHAQSISARNIGYEVLQSAGLIMAASSPFIGKSGTAHHFQTFTTIANGPLLAAYNLIWPDPIVRQLNNLDDQAFRDNIVIANNAQIQTLVFVERQALTQSLQDLAVQLNLVRKQAKPKATDQATQNLDWLQERMSKSLQTTTKNSTRPIWKMPVWGQGSNPLLVKLALGKLVIVGDQIEYLQRIQVTSPATPSAASPLTANPSSLNFSSQNGVTSGSAQTITLGNTGSAPLTGVAFQISGTNAADFKETDTCGTTIAAGANCTVSVTYNPAATPTANPRTANLQVSFSPGSTPLTIPLGGAASNTVYLSASQLSLGNATVTPSAPATANLTITNFNGSSATVSIPNSPPFTASQCNGGTLNANTSCTVTITFTPTTAGPQSTSLTATFQVTGGGSTPAGINVSGNGK